MLFFTLKAVFSETKTAFECIIKHFVSRGGLAVSMCSYETIGPGSILGVAIFPG